MRMTISADTYWQVVAIMGAQAAEDIRWAESIKPPADADDMALELVFILCNSGMHHVVASGIYTKCSKILVNGGTVQGQVLGRHRKAGYIDDIWRDRRQLFAEWQALADDAARLEYLENIPGIGPITKYHAAKNFAMQVAKPDVHLMRLAALERTTPQDLCERLARETGHKVATVDTVLWRACATGVLDGRSGKLT
jgi:hypothetical protein